MWRCNIINKLLKYEWVAWLIAALFYYVSLSCFRYTWIFASGDSGDWLASTKIWFVPQPFGSPLYITLAHAIGLIGGNLAKNMTFWLSCLPSAITIALVFQSVKNLTNKVSLARISALICLGACVLTSQSIIIEEYALAVMLLSASILAYTSSHKHLAVIFIGLACAVHIIVFPIAFVFMVSQYKEWRYWIKRIPLFLLFAILPYGLILFLMYADTPRWIAGSLSLQSINSYLGSTSTIGKLAMVEAPQRIIYLLAFIIGAFGIAIIPAIRYGISHRKYALSMMLFLTTCLSWWLYLTDTDWTTWTFTIYAVPCIAILASLGLKHSYRMEKILVVCSAIVLIICNMFLCNANQLDKVNPIASELYNETMSLPDGSYILTSKGGFYTLGILHVIADGKNVIPIFLSEPKTETDYGYKEWLEWARKEYGIIGDNSIDIVKNSSVRVFYVDTEYMNDWSEVYAFKEYSMVYKEVMGIK